MAARVRAAALRLGGEVFDTLDGRLCRNHGEALVALELAGRKWRDTPDCEQGFTLPSGEFVSRDEAARRFRIPYAVSDGGGRFAEDYTEEGLGYE